MSCSYITNNDKPTCSFLASRIFDNVRFELARNTVGLSFLPEPQMPLYVSGKGAVTLTDTLTVSPHYNEGYASINGSLILPGVLQYISNGATETEGASISVPFSVNMKIPSDSIWQFDVIAHYSYFGDNITKSTDGSYSCIADGAVIVYITSYMPITVEANCQMTYNAISDKAEENINAYSVTDFYPNIDLR